MRTWELREDRVELLYSCCENIHNGVQVLNSLKILQKIIDNFSVSPATTDRFTKSQAIEHLSQEKNLLTSLIQNLNQFKKTIKEKAATEIENKTLTEAKLNAISGERSTYLQHITNRL